MTDLKEVFEARRSVNFFDKQKGLDEQVLQNIINLATLAPSAFNLQPWQIIAVKTDEAKKRLYPLASNQPKILDAPVTLIIIGDRAGYEKDNPAWSDLEKMLGNKEALEKTQQFAYALYGTTPERKIKFAESNAGLLAASIMYAAKYFGVESHAMSGIDFEGIHKEFKLGTDKEVVMLIALGYFDESKTLYPRRFRKNFKDMVQVV
ncbi:MAG TPA: nitroreductase [Firmicutes bacterium]|jgi:putative NAD(P)H nitroreductase|nr:nitroreductase [Bacillota bacterium]